MRSAGTSVAEAIASCPVSLGEDFAAGDAGGHSELVFTTVFRAHYFDVVGHMFLGVGLGERDFRHLSRRQLISGKEVHPLRADVADCDRIRSGVGPRYQAARNTYRATICGTLLAAPRFFRKQIKGGLFLNRRR